MTHPSAPHIIFELLTESNHGAFALEVHHVLRVLDLELIVPVPLAPPPVRGIMNHNGRIVTVADPAPLLGLPLQQQAAAQALLLRREGRRQSTLSLLVRSVVAVVPRHGLERVDVKAGPCVSWVAKSRHRFVHVVDVDLLLRDLIALFGVETRNEPLGAGL